MTRFLAGMFFLMSLASSCSKNPKVDKALIYSTLNEIIQQDSIFAHIVCSKFDKVEVPYDIQQKFFENDASFLQDQINNSKNAIIDAGKLYFYWRRKERLEKSFIDTSCSSGIIYHLAYPIFSKDLQTVVVGVTENCNCMLGGWSFKAVYKRQAGKWVKVKEFDRWIS